MSSPRPNTRLRERTRATILRSAITVLAANPAASLSEVTSAAGVARSTLHRYFPDRAALLSGIQALAAESYQDAVEQARIDENSGAEAYDRLVGELLDRLDVLAWLHNDDAIENFDSPADERIMALIERGRRDGTLHADVDVRWGLATTWTLIWTVFMEAQAGHRTERELREMCHRSLMRLAVR